MACLLGFQIKIQAVWNIETFVSFVYHSIKKFEMKLHMAICCVEKSLNFFYKFSEKNATWKYNRQIQLALVIIVKFRFFKKAKKYDDSPKCSDLNFPK